MKRILIVLFVVLSSSLTHARGEWESSGAPPPPYIPEGQINYHCKLEISHMQGDGYVTEKRQVTFHTADFQQNGSAYYQIEKDRVVWVNDQSISLRFRRNAADTGDEVLLMSSSNLTVDGGKISSFSDAEAPRSQKTIRGLVSSTFRPTDASRPSTSTTLDVTCGQL